MSTNPVILAWKFLVPYTVIVVAGWALGFLDIMLETGYALGKSADIFFIIPLTIYAAILGAFSGSIIGLGMVPLLRARLRQASAFPWLTMLGIIVGATVIAMIAVQVMGYIDVDSEKLEGWL